MTGHRENSKTLASPGRTWVSRLNSESTVAREDNLTPFQPGESGNPHGRPKGSRNLSTILREILETEIDYSESEDKPKVKTKYSDIIVKRLIKNATEGDVKSIQEVFDRTEGKAKQEVVSTNVNYNSELTQDEIKKISESLDDDV